MLAARLADPFECLAGSLIISLAAKVAEAKHAAPATTSTSGFRPASLDDEWFK